MAGDYVIGVDGGTEGLRAGVFNRSGSPLAFASTAYKTHFPNPGWAEQNPADWWAALGESVRKAVSEAGVAPDAIAAISVDTTCCSVLALDENGEPLRPCMIWMDLRSAAQTEKVVATGDPALRVNSNGAGPVSAEWMVPKALWIKENEPDLFDRAATICEYQDYINYHLTGRMVASVNNVSVRWHYRSREGGYAADMARALGMEAILEKWPKDVLSLGEVIGGLTARAAAHLGLPEGLPVAQGGADAFIGVIGLGVVRPGRLAFITGSSHLQIGLSDAPFHGTGIWGTYSDAVLPGLHVIEGGQTSTGSVVNWFKSMLGPDVSYDALNAEARTLPPGSEGLVALDHFQGNRTPHTDPLSRGVLAGLSLKHGRGHIFRALIEGISFGSELILETMRSNGFKPTDIVIAGGATRSDLWLQIHADVSGLPLSLTKVADAPSLGCAVLAAVAAGFYEDIPAAADAMVQVDRRVEPDMTSYEAYRPFYEAYKATYPALKDVVHAQVDAAAGSG